MILTKRLLRRLRPDRRLSVLTTKACKNKELPPRPPLRRRTPAPAPSRNPTDEVHESQFNLSRNPAHMLDRSPTAWLGNSRFAAEWREGKMTVGHKFQGG
jgi:hypothetical protein